MWFSKLITSHSHVIYEAHDTLHLGILQQITEVATPLRGSLPMCC